MGKAIGSIAKELRDALSGKNVSSEAGKRFEKTMTLAVVGVANKMRTEFTSASKHNANVAADTFTRSMRGAVNLFETDLRNAIGRATATRAGAAVGPAIPTVGAQQAGAAGAAAFTKEMRSAIAQLAQDMRRVLGGSAATSAGKAAADAFTTAMRSAIARIALDMRRILARAMPGARGGPGAGFPSGGPGSPQAAIPHIRDFAEAMNLADQRTRDWIGTVSRIHVPEQEFKELVRLQLAATAAQSQLTDAINRFGASSQDVLRFTQRVREANAAVAAQERTVRSQTAVATTEYAKLAEKARVSQQGQTTVARAEASERIVAMQTEAAKETAIIRAAGQRRVAIIRAVTQQVRALERGLAAVFRTSAKAFGNLASAAARWVGRLGSVFSRSNKEMTSGLSSAMGRRESILRTSMSRQERIIQSSTIRQSAQITRLEAASSRGIAGVVSGRSQLGAILGGGLAIGGGFAAVGLLKNLFTASADFEQGMAVLDAQLDLTDRQMVRVRETAIELGNDLTLPGVSAKDAGEAIAILGKQFGSLGKGAIPAARAAAKGVLQLSRATGASAEDAAKIVGSAVNVFGVEASKAVQVADQVAGALTKAAGVSLGDFALTFRQGAGVFAGFQVEAVGADQALLDFNTSIAVLAKGGLVGSDAGTSLKQFFLQANRGTADSTKAMKTLVENAGETGGAFFDAAHNARPFQESLDILRRGMEGMNDEARQKTLQKIFGSDAINAARLLTGTSEEAFLAIQNGIKKEGLAAEIAAAQNTGLRGAMDAFSSVIETMALEVLPKITKPLGNLVLGFASFITNLRSGEGIYATVRTALKGIALGLGAILAAKGAIEVFRFLLILARGLLTPLGIISLLAAGVGAAFTLMMERSIPFRDAITNLKETLGDFAGAGIEFVKDRLTDLADFLGGLAGTVSAFLGDVFKGSDIEDELAQISAGIDTRTLGEKIGDKIRDIFAVARDVIGNAQELLGDLFFGTDVGDQFAEAMGGVDTRSKFEKIGGAIREVVFKIRDAVVKGFRIARDAIVDFWDAVQPVIAPLVEGLKEVADAFANLILDFDLGDLARIGGVLAAALGGFAVGGPIGGVIAGAGAAIALLFGDSLGKGLLETLGNIGSVIINALKGPFNAVKDFLGQFFTLDNLKSVVAGFLDLVEQVGFIIGNILTDPRVLAVVAGLAALAVAAAFRFVQGLARGIADNLPEIGNLLLTGLKKLGEVALQGLAAVFTNPTLLISALGGILVGTRLISMFRQAGTSAGTGFFSGFKQTAFSGAFRGGGAGTIFGTGGAFVTGLLGSPGSIQAAVDRELGRTATAVSRRMNSMRSVLRIAGQDIIGPRTTRDVERQFAALSQTLGPAGIAGLQLRAAVKATFDSIRTLSLDPLRQLGKGTVAAMTQLGKGMAGGLAAGFAGFQTGRALAKSSLFEQILGIGGLALAVGSMNIPAGIAAGAMGALGVVITNFGHESTGAKEQLDGLIGSIQGLADPIPGIISSIVTQFSKLSPAVQDALIISNFDVTGFANDIKEGLITPLEAFVETISTFDPALKPILTPLLDDIQSGKMKVGEFFDLIDQDTNLDLTRDQIKELFTFVVGQGGVATFALEEFNKEQEITGEAAEEGGKKAKKAGGGWEELMKKILETTGIDVSKLFSGLGGAIDTTTTRMEALRTKSDETKTKIEELFQVGAGGPTTLQNARRRFRAGAAGDLVAVGVGVVPARGRHRAPAVHRRDQGQGRYGPERPPRGDRGGRQDQEHQRRPQGDRGADHPGDPSRGRCGPDQTQGRDGDDRRPPGRGVRPGLPPRSAAVLQRAAGDPDPHQDPGRTQS